MPRGTGLPFGPPPGVSEGVLRRNGQRRPFGSRAGGFPAGDFAGPSAGGFPPGGVRGVRVLRWNGFSDRRGGRPVGARSLPGPPPGLSERGVRRLNGRRRDPGALGVRGVLAGLFVSRGGFWPRAICRARRRRANQTSSATTTATAARTRTATGDTVHNATPITTATATTMAHPK